MSQYFSHYSQAESFINNPRRPDFNNLLAVLKGERPSRPTLFEFIIDESIGQQLTKGIHYEESDPFAAYKRRADMFRIAGYDFVAMTGSDLSIVHRKGQKEQSESVSLNGGWIADRADFDAFPWTDVDKGDFSRLEAVAAYIPDGMKIIPFGPDGVLENVISLTGYEGLCYMLYEDPDLVEALFAEVGKRLVRYYEICGQNKAVGAMVSNDDWGFNTQPMLSVKDMQKYVFPWHKKIVEAIHAAGVPAILHSCGNPTALMDDIVHTMKFDGRHSYEDNIIPVETAYDRYSSEIAILGGLDINFLCTASPEQVYNRAAAMLERTRERGRYALGSGNSVPPYVSFENYLAMIAAAVLG